nr:four helix bundle protein [Confluentibacter sediminis]
MYTYSFKKLEVWVEAKKLSKDIYTVTSKFSPDEKFGSISHLIRISFLFV